MAKAAKIQETVTKREKVNRIQLTLTEGEADFLQAILAHIGGDPTTSPRKYQERIARVLRNATGQSYSHGCIPVDQWWDHVCRLPPARTEARRHLRAADA